MDRIPQVLDEPSNIPEEYYTEGEVDDQLIHRDEEEEEEVIEQEVVEEPQPEPEPDHEPQTLEQIFDGAPKLRRLNSEKKPRKKRVLTEEHKEKLKLAREKALITRRRNAAKRKEIKELEKRKEENKMKQLRKEAGVDEEKGLNPSMNGFNEEEPEPPEPVAPTPKPRYREPHVKSNLNSDTTKLISLTAEELEKIQFDAINKHELLRKKREERKKRAEKKQQLQKELDEQENIVKEELKSIMTPQQVKKYGRDGYWEDFF